LWSTTQISRILTRPIYTSNSLDVYNYYLNSNINIVDDTEAFDGKKSLSIVGKETGKGEYRKTVDISEQFLVTVDVSPIIDSETWLKVQNKMSNNKQFAPRFGQSKKCFLSSLLCCGECGYSMSIKSQSKKNSNNNIMQYDYICCNTKKSHGYSVCSSKLHKISLIEESVIIHLVNHLIENKVYEKMTNVKDIKQIDVSLINKRSLLEVNISKSNKEIQNLLKVIAEGNTIANNYIQKNIEDIDFKIQKYKDELNVLENEIYNTYSQYDNIEDIKEYLKNPKKIIDYDFDTKKKICKALIQKIVITNEELDITYLY